MCARPPHDRAIALELRYEVGDAVASCGLPAVTEHLRLDPAQRHEGRAMIVRKGNESRERCVGQLSPRWQGAKRRRSVVPDDVRTSPTTHDLDHVVRNQRTKVAT